MSKKYSLVELFCGCGGFSYGFEWSGKFSTKIGVDIKKEALKTFEFNHHDQPIVFRDDIRKIPNEDIVNALKEKGVEVGELDCLIGGPPCQGFSQMRRINHRDKSKIVGFSGYSKLEKDPRNDLILRFLEIAEALMPKFIVIENVKQVKNHVLNGKEGGFILAIEEVLGQLGYDVTHKILNAADYGVPQLRERAFVVASRDGKATFPIPSHGLKDDLFDTALERVTVKDAISDLPLPPLKEDSLGGCSTNLYRHKPESNYQRLMRSEAEVFPFNHITRTYSKKILDIISEMPPGKTWNEVSDIKRAEYAPLLGAIKSDEELQTKIDELGKKGFVNPVFYKKYYWSAYTRLAYEKPALTVTANANFLGSGRYTHPEEQRGITPREAARLQSFPDSFKFITDSEDLNSTERSGVAMDMIGEAVPPLLAKAFAEHIAEQLESICGKFTKDKIAS